MATTLTQKICKVCKSTKKPKAHKLQKPHKNADTPCTTAKPLRQPKEDLTLADWLEVLDYIETNEQNKLQVRAVSNPNALSEKQQHIVTRLDVDEALNSWQQDMNCKGELVTGPMLVEKRAWLEVLFDVPIKERTEGHWLVKIIQTSVCESLPVLSSH
ncbi:hypothetical protein BT96DRAFT_991903 [Gymnopus androsaceus JB14]|uniref:Uncharacterized protein n=1 Tax=Gymnopus androsaceus JB14 TaxID=1447944 RepID=A0A6A4HU80_9AGAR|nr:hypothetical protein BT96DRAFT_991903 [Gymnopus androsaceus JB14]